MIVPINYFDPSNGQAMNLEQRVAELFKANAQVEIPELHKTYSSSQEQLLMSEVTSWYEGKKILTKVELISQDYTNSSAFLDEIRNTFEHFVPPIIVTFSTKNALKEFLEHLNELNPQTKTAVRCSSFTCKLNNRGLFLNLNKSEIMRCLENQFPISIQFKCIEDLYNLSPSVRSINSLKQKPLKGSCFNDEINEKRNPYKKYIWSAAIIAGITAGFFTYRSEFSSTDTEDKEGLHSIQNNDYSGSEKTNATHQANDEKIRKNIIGKEFTLNKMDSDMRTQNTVTVIFKKGGTGVYIFQQTGGKSYGTTTNHREPFSWDVSDGEIYVTDSYGETDTFTYGSGLFCDYIYNNGDKYSADTMH